MQQDPACATAAHSSNQGPPTSPAPYLDEKANPQQDHPPTSSASSKTSAPSPMIPANSGDRQQTNYHGEPIVPRSSSMLSRARLTGPLDGSKGDFALLAHSFVTGMVDAATFANWAVFVGMQTGNTVILGLSSATLPNNPHAWSSTLVSLGSFLVGAFFTFRSTSFILRPSTPSSPPRTIASNRLWLSTIYLLQGLLIIIAAALVTPAHLVPHNRSPGVPDDAHTRGVIGNIKIISLLPPLAFQSGMQIATTRLLGFNELPVNVLTSSYADLMGDPALFAIRKQNIKRNRRLASVVLLVVGSISSAWIMRSRGGMMAVFWVAGGVKVVVALATLLLHPAADVVVPPPAAAK
ncbi:hypothetical protein AAFC00_000075 [Neodothiora populina]|uniref:DUF1275 domain protein n=1 Tax=Neodothiora populina TaxID=2781224 RepID=A0ABR3P1A5_9PEZI